MPCLPMTVVQTFFFPAICFIVSFKHWQEWFFEVDPTGGKIFIYFYSLTIPHYVSNKHRSRRSLSVFLKTFSKSFPFCLTC